ncbi:hypothetical protein J3F84DRAFT_368840 [Trichoderma pleuroticola]
MSSIIIIRIHSSIGLAHLAFAFSNVNSKVYCPESQLHGKSYIIITPGDSHSVYNLVYTLLFCFRNGISREFLCVYEAFSKAIIRFI